MKKERSSATGKILTILGIVLCLILVPILVINLTLIVKSYINKDEVPSIGGKIPLIDPAGNGTSVVTHRVIEIIEEEGEIFFRTRGDNNNTDDKKPVPTENLVGIYQTRVPSAGHVAMFMQSTTGLVLCVVLPIVLLVAYDFARRRIYEKNNKNNTDELLAELQALRAEKAEKEKAEKEKEEAANAGADSPES